MGRGRGTRAILALVGTASLALPFAACGTESHPNDPRPPLAAEVTVNITDTTLDVSPSKVGFGKSNSAALSQNDIDEPQSNRKAPLVVRFTSSNTTTADTVLEISGPVDERSGPILAGSNNVFKAALPNGTYSLEAADIPGAPPARFKVGPSRVSSQNDLLLP
jgi:hypothetical protein